MIQISILKCHYYQTHSWENKKKKRVKKKLAVETEKFEQEKAQGFRTGFRFYKNKNKVEGKSFVL